MLWLSEIVLQNDTIDSFSAMAEGVQHKAGAGEMFFRTDRRDVKPPFPDIPVDWARTKDYSCSEAAFFSSNTNPD